MTSKERFQLKMSGVAAIAALVLVAGCDRCACTSCGDNSQTTTTPTKPEAPGDGVDLTVVPLIAQQTSKWCWAASAEMTMSALKRDVPQCEQAKNATGRNCCALNTLKCPDPDETDACVTTSWPDYGHFNFSAEPTDEQALSWDELTGELLAGRPVAFTWRTEEGGHMMVAHGFQSDGKMVQIYDPLPTCEGTASVISYDDYVAKPGYYTHWNDFFGITNLGPLPVSAPISSRLQPIVVAQPILATPQPAPSLTIKLVSDVASAAVTKLGARFPRELGLPPGTQSAQVSLGTPIKMATVHFAEIKAFTPGTNPNTLVRDTGEYLVPVILNGPPAPRTISAVRVLRTGAGFRAVGLGFAPLARAVTTGLANVPAGASDVKLVQIPTLQVDFLGYQKANALWLRPLPPAKSAKFLPTLLRGDSPTPLPWSPPAELTAADAFQRLVQRAKEYPTKYPG